MKLAGPQIDSNSVQAKSQQLRADSFSYPLQLALHRAVVDHAADLDDGASENGTILGVTRAHFVAGQLCDLRFQSASFRLAQLPLEDALRAASLTPARFLGADKERGALVPGARADLVALTQELTVVATWLDGSTDDVKSDWKC